MQLVACDREPPTADAPAPVVQTPTPAAPEPTPPTTAAPTPEPPPPEPTPEVAPAVAPSEPPAPVPDVAVPLVDGLPAFTDGKPIRLPSLPISERKLDRAKVPSVAITDALSRAELDKRIERARIGSCKVLLALETAVSMRCAFTDEMSEQATHDATHFRVGVGGDVETVDAWSFLHPGLSSQDFIKLLLHNPGADDRVATFTNAGLELTRPWGEPEDTSRLPWRAIAPYVRADGALAPALVAEGLALAPVGTQVALPTESAAIWALGADELTPLWLGLPAELRAKARLVTPGGPDPAGLVFAPDVEPSELMTFSRAVGRGFFVEPTAKLVLVRAKEQVLARTEPGSKTDVSAVLPAGTLFAAAEGTVDRTQSGLGAKHWSFVGGFPYGSWIAGRSLEPAERCVDPPASREGMSLALHGITELVKDGGPERVAWIAYAPPKGEGTELDVHPLAGCTMQPRTRKLVLPRAMRALYFVEAAKGGDTLVVVLAEGPRYSGLSELLVFGPEGDAPIHRRERFDGTVEIGATKGPDGAAGWFPVVLVSGKTRTWLAWNGTALEERTAP